jgi:hypothetical protein
MEKAHARIRLDENMFTELVKGGQVTTLFSPSIKVDMILADIGYARMLDILEKALDDLSKAGGSERFEGRKNYPTMLSSATILKPLSEITEEDITELGKILGYVITDTCPLFVIEQKVGTFLSIDLDDKGFSYHPQEAFKAYQYLQSKNYKLPKYF